MMLYATDEQNSHYGVFILHNPDLIKGFGGRRSIEDQILACFKDKGINSLITITELEL